MDWLINHFIPHTNGCVMGRYRMLILDGHGSHLTAEFDHTYTENNIIPVCMPPHSSHLLQPLDISCFAILKRQYRQLVEQQIKLGFNHINKINFLTAFPKARTIAYKAKTIQNGFAATRLMPFNPDQVYQQLTIQLRTPTPPPSQSSNTQSSCLQTPQNPHQFKRQLTTIKKRISQRTGSPLNSVNKVINQMSKAYEMTTNSLMLLGKEVHDLQATHEKKKQKHRQSRRQITHEQGITREEAQALIQSQIEMPQSITTALTEPELPASQALVRRQFRCSECNTLGHRRPQCPNRTSN
jgi:hypothetical protein